LFGRQRIDAINIDLTIGIEPADEICSVGAAVDLRNVIIAVYHADIETTDVRTTRPRANVMLWLPRSFVPVAAEAPQKVHEPHQ